MKLNFIKDNKNTKNIPTITVGDEKYKVKENVLCEIIPGLYVNKLPVFKRKSATNYDVGKADIGNGYENLHDLEIFLALYFYILAIHRNDTTFRIPEAKLRAKLGYSRTGIYNNVRRMRDMGLIKVLRTGAEERERLGLEHMVIYLSHVYTIDEKKFDAFLDNLKRQFTFDNLDEYLEQVRVLYEIQEEEFQLSKKQKTRTKFEEKIFDELTKDGNEILPIVTEYNVSAVEENKLSFVDDFKKRATCELANTANPHKRYNQLTLSNKELEERKVMLKKIYGNDKIYDFDFSASIISLSMYLNSQIDNNEYVEYATGQKDAYYFLANRVYNAVRADNGKEWKDLDKKKFRKNRDAFKSFVLPLYMKGKNTEYRANLKWVEINVWKEIWEEGRKGSITNFTKIFSLLMDKDLENAGKLDYLKLYAYFAMTINQYCASNIFREYIFTIESLGYIELANRVYNRTGIKMSLVYDCFYFGTDFDYKYANVLQVIREELASSMMKSVSILANMVQMLAERENKAKKANKRKAAKKGYRKADKTLYYRNATFKSDAEDNIKYIFELQKGA